MLNFIRAIKFAAIVGVAAATLAAGSTASRAESGAVRLHIVKAGLIVGVGGGSGTLVFKGRSYRLSLGGIGVGSLGVAAVHPICVTLATSPVPMGRRGRAAPSSPERK